MVKTLFSGKIYGLAITHLGNVLIGCTYLTFSVNFTVAKVFEEGWGCIRFRRVLFGETAKLWAELKTCCANVMLSKDRDSCRWLLTKNGFFSVKSLYNFLKVQQVQCKFKSFWKIQIPL